MSPEQMKAKELDARTDLFSFGAVLCEIAAGIFTFLKSGLSTLDGVILKLNDVSASTVFFVRHHKDDAGTVGPVLHEDAAHSRMHCANTFYRCDGSA